MKTGSASVIFLGLMVGNGQVNFAGAPAFAQNYPARTVTIIVPFPAGGSTDILGRTIARKLGESWGQQVIVDNRPGAGGNIGMALAAKAAPDGYTLVMGSDGSIAINPSLYRKLPFDPLRDYVPVTQLVTIPLILAVHPSIPAKTVRELVVLARARPDQLNYGSGGNGTIGHISGEMFKTATGTKIVHIPYRGSTQAITDLIGGQVALVFGGIPTMLPHVRSGKLKALAVSSIKRSAAVPELPTVDEAGVRGFEISFWLGLLAPAGTPGEIVNRVNSEIVRILNLSDIRERFASLGADPVGSSPAEFAAHIRKELPKYAKVVKEAGMRVD